MSLSFRRLGTRAAADASIFEFTRPPDETRPEQPTSPAHIALSLLFDRMLVDTCLTGADAGRYGAVIALARPPGQDASSYICKLRDFLQRETALAATVTRASPQSAPTLIRRRRATVDALASLFIERRALDGIEVSTFLEWPKADFIGTVTL